MKRVATIILNRNLAEVTDRLYEHLAQNDGDLTDVFVVEAGSDASGKSKYATWHAGWPEAVSQGLRFNRGMNYGLSQLWKEGRFDAYDAFFLLTNDTELPQGSTLQPLMKVLDQHPRVGVLSPCGTRWGERLLLQNVKTKYFWFIHNNALLIRKAFMESVINHQSLDFMGFLFDGTNFRGYGSVNELIAKAYINDWAAAITTEVFVGEDESLLLNQAALIKTEKYEDNLKLYLEEGRVWMRNKYGFNSHWSMQQYVKNFYDRFFDFHPEYKAFQI